MEKNPMFLEKRAYQGSTGKVYPLPICETVSETKEDRTYRAVILENDYLYVMVLPELGGRIQRALDKTNNYDFVYYNRVIKPALVGLTGPWISGGIEFNWPQHHRPSTFSPVDYRYQENADGSATVVLGETDRMYGTKGNAAITLDETNANPNAPTGSGRVTENTYNVYPGLVVDKDPTVTNVGSNDAWIRAKIVVKANMEQLNQLGLIEAANDATGEKLAKIFKLGAGWSYTGKVIMGEDGTFTFVMKYADKLAPKAATPVFTQVTIPGETVVDSFNFNINVVAEAIQADGFTTWDAAFAAFDK